MSARHGQSSYRDRTKEFFDIVESLRRSITPAANNVNDGSRREDLINKSEFNKRASKIGLAINQTSQKLSKLAKLAKRTSVFDDPTQEIQELTVVIKQEISALNTALLDLQVLRSSQNGEENNSRDTSTHSTTVVDVLKNRLMDTTKDFKDVLTMRTENMKIHENRRQLFSSNASKESTNPFVRQRPLAAKASASESAPLPWANGSSSSSSQLVPWKQGEAESSPLLQQSQQQQQQQQQMVPLQDTYMQSRAEALHNVESTIHELGNIFTQLATMVSQQGEIAIRIDQNMEDTLANVEGAQSQLARYLNSISSNRWLMMKIFFVLIAFLMIFLFFVA
ncbi:Target SNARE coiled-coil homology domain [Arabidopsis thaliana x Arabidopsis arenosa]|uniref:Target SNARE coiled-coil homology domain n=1 Tax=Arabidopsis thaliana x Arabidopsis arenosa TaxID=1240361 RepID=A0A8T2AWL3_9BRAS|nr:Target SNARE coiled-coil homology domain [Arabidopsis thaliana x Arabidopsis arenosa]